MLALWPRSDEISRLLAPSSFAACATCLALICVQCVRKGSGAFGPAWNWRKQTSTRAPMSVNLLGLCHGQPWHAGKPVGDEHVLHPELASAPYHGDDLLGMHMTGGEHEV